MPRFCPGGGIIVLALVSWFQIAHGQQKGYPITPVPFTVVSVNDAFWGPRIETNRTVTIPYAFKQCEETGRVRNFDLADSILAGTLQKGAFCSRYGFDDSDLYKIIEGAAYSLHTRFDRNLDTYLDGLISRIGLAQEHDGYLYTMRTIDPEKSWAKQRWVNDRLVEGSHELYNMGQLYEAAVAHYSATGKRSLFAIALKNADLLCETFGPEKMRTVPGHQGIEIGLAKLYLVTGQKKYLDLAKFFLDERGKPRGETYNQDHLPVVEQSEAVGHAVRAAYMYSGMADVAALTGDESYIRAIDRIWDDVVRGKLYLTGGIGAAGSIEGFGAQYELPNLSAYCETCASIANVFWNFRMFLRHGNARYLDIVERVIYNGFLSGVSIKGDRFFYPNPLESFRSHARSPWFPCACCPSNIVRFIPSIAGYIYALQADTVYVNLFIGGRADLKVGGTPMTISQQSNYPWEGNVEIAVDPRSPERFTVAVRIPGWAQGTPLPGGLYSYIDRRPSEYSVSVNGKKVREKPADGFLKINRRWNAGDTIVVNLAMPVRRVVAREEVEDDRGKAALERGPLLFCLEGKDCPDGHVLSLVVPDDTPLQTTFSKDLLGGVQTIRGQALIARRALDGGILVDRKGEFAAIPYYAWAHRGEAEMTVWPARENTAAKPLPAPTIAFLSRLTSSGGEGADAIKDQLPPRSSNDRNIPYFHWWPRKGSIEWVQYDFGKKEVIRKVSVYWFDDTGSGKCRVPKSWRILYKSGNEWEPIENTVCGVEKDRPNDAMFTPVETDGMRLEIQLQDEFSAGLYEWSVE